MQINETSAEVCTLRVILVVFTYQLLLCAVDFFICIDTDSKFVLWVV